MSQNVYLIKDLSRLSGHSVHTLKFYLKRGLIKESGRSPETRFRYFNDATLAQLSQIRAWRKQRNSLSEIQLLLNATGSSTLQASSSTSHMQHAVAGSMRPGAIPLA